MALVANHAIPAIMAMLNIQSRIQSAGPSSVASGNNGENLPTKYTRHIWKTAQARNRFWKATGAMLAMMRPDKAFAKELYI